MIDIFSNNNSNDTELDELLYPEDNDLINSIKKEFNIK